MKNWRVHKDGERFSIRFETNEKELKEIEKTLNDLGISYSKNIRIIFDIRKMPDIKKFISIFPNPDMKKQKFMERYLKSKFY